jgi:hypothetical protein
VRLREQGSSCCALGLAGECLRSVHGGALGCLILFRRPKRRPIQRWQRKWRFCRDRLRMGDDAPDRHVGMLLAHLFLPTEACRLPSSVGDGGKGIRASVTLRFRNGRRSDGPAD